MGCSLPRAPVAWAKLGMPELLVPFRVYCSLEFLGGGTLVALVLPASAAPSWLEALPCLFMCRWECIVLASFVTWPFLRGPPQAPNCVTCIHVHLSLCISPGRTPPGSTSPSRLAYTQDTYDMF